MKQGLFANCYSTIHGLNLIKHIYTHKQMHTHTHTHKEFCGLKRVLRLTLFCYLITLPEEDHSRVTSLFLLHTDQSTSNKRDLFGLLVSVEFSADLVFPMCFLETSGCWLCDVTGETLMWLAVAWCDAVRKLDLEFLRLRALKFCRSLWVL